MDNLFFITGASGAGKSTIIEPLKQLLGSGFDIHDFDERGVPDAADNQWRIDETAYWASVAEQNTKVGLSTIICGGARPSELKGRAIFIFLDASEEIIRGRLLKRYSTPASIKEIERASGGTLDKFIKDNEIFLQQRRLEAKNYKTSILDTSEFTPHEVTKVVAEIIKSYVYYRGVIIEESLSDKAILNQVRILSTKVEPVTEKHKTSWLKQWTLHTVEVPNEQAKEVAQELSKTLDYSNGSVWYADSKNEPHHYIVFLNKVFFIDRTSKEQYDEAKKYGISLGIPEHQVDFHPDIKQWDR